MEEPLFTLEHDGDVHVVSFRREMFDPEQVEALKRQVRALVDEAEAPKVMVSFAELRYASSAFLGAIMELAVRIARKDGQLRLCCMRPQVRQLFNMMNLDRMVQIHDTAAEARASFG